jgi:hypothetical protein
VVNVLTGRVAELAPVAASHRDVNALDLTGAANGDRTALERAAAGNLKRVYGAGKHWDDEQWEASPGTRRLLAAVEIKTVWHPVGT